MEIQVPIQAVLPPFCPVLALPLSHRTRGKGAGEGHRKPRVTCQATERPNLSPEICARLSPEPVFTGETFLKSQVEPNYSTQPSFQLRVFSSWEDKAGADAQAMTTREIEQLKKSSRSNKKLPSSLENDVRISWNKTHLGSWKQVLGHVNYQEGTKPRGKARHRHAQSPRWVWLGVF